MVEGNFPRGKGKLKINKQADETIDNTNDQFSSTKTTPNNKNHKRFFDEYNDDDHNDNDYDNDENEVLKNHEKHTQKLQRSIKIQPQGCIYIHPKKTNEITINSIKFNNLSNTMKLLCTVKTIEDSYIIVSLPNMLTGYYYKDDNNDDDDDDDDVSLKKLYKYLSKLCTVSIVSTSSITTQGKEQKKIEVSFDPMDINVGITYDTLYNKQVIRSRIISEEDYGYIVDIGIIGVVSFLKCKKKDDLYIGSILDLQITKLENDNKSVTLSLLDAINDDSYKEVETELFRITNESNDKNNNNSSNSVNVTDLQSLIPGNLLRFHVEEYCTNGIIIGFGGGGTNIFQGAIELSQLLPSHEQSNDWKKYWNAYRNSNKRLLGRIVCIDSHSKILRLSLLPHVMTLNNEPVLSENALDVGTILKDLEIIRIDKGFGALTTYPLDRITSSLSTMDKNDHDNDTLDEDDLSYTMDDVNDNEFGNAFSDSDDDKEQQQEKKKKNNKSQSILSTHNKPLNYVSIYILFPKNNDSTEQYEVGNKLKKVRIVSKTKWIMDNYVEGSIDPLILNASIFSYNQLTFGSIYKCTITKILTDKALNNIKLYVSLGPNLNGIITSQHFYDKGSISTYKLQALIKKYKEGMSISAKYIHVDDYNNHYMTLKPSLLKHSETQSFMNNDDLKINDVSIGYISKKDNKKGIHVMFYNKIHGIIPLYDVVSFLGKDWYTVYDLGDVIKCRIITIESFKNSHDGEESVSHRLILSLNLSTSTTITDDEMKEDIDNDNASIIQVGTVINKDIMKIYEITSKDIKVIIKYNKIFKNQSSNDKHKEENIVGSIPFTQIFDTYNDNLNQDTIRELYPIGTRIQCKGIILENKNNITSQLPYVVISLRSSFINIMEKNSIKKNTNTEEEDVDNDNDKSNNNIMLPSSYSQLSKHTYILGCIYNIDERYGTFIKCLNGITGFIPKKIKVDLTQTALNNTIVCQVINIDNEHDKKPQLIVRPKYEYTNYIIKESFSKCRSNIGDIIHVNVSKHDDNNDGCIHVQTIDSGGDNIMKGIIPSLEVSTDIKILQNLQKYYPIGKLLQVCIIDKFIPNNDDEDEEDNETILILSILNVKDTNAVNLPKIGDVVTGRINRKLMNINPTSILIEIRNLTNTTTTTTPRFYVRCCITELMDNDDWINEPIGKFIDRKDQGQFPHGMYVQVKLLSYPTVYPNTNTIIPPIIYINGTMRPSQIKNKNKKPNQKEDLKIPMIGDTIKGYVCKKTSKECMILASSSSSNSNIICRVMPGKPTYPIGCLAFGTVMDVCDLMNGDIGIQLDTSSKVN